MDRVREVMSASVIQLTAHENMTPEECLAYASRNAVDYDDVIVVGVAKDGGHVMLNSSHMTREFAVFILLEALDQARGK